MLSATKSRLAGKTFLQTLFFFLLVTQICFAQWHQQNSGTIQNINDVVFFDNYAGIAIGNGSTILRTTSSGTTWTPITINITADIKAMSFVNAYNGWAIAAEIDSARIIHTTDGGTFWTTQILWSPVTFRDIYFIDSLKGWFIDRFFDCGGGMLCNRIFKTLDGGTVWTQIEDDSIDLRKIFFIDENNGWVVGDSGYVMYTVDGGENWLHHNSGVMTNLIFVQFINQNIGWIGGRDVMLKTTDGGTNWTTTQTPGLTTTSVCFVDESNGWAVANTNLGYSGKILHSTDGGENWTAQLTDVKPLWSIQFVDENSGWVVGDSGSIYHTTNGGVSFVEEEVVNEMPTEFLLSQNYPNPFNPSTKIKYSVPQSSNVTIKVFDVLGNEIETLVNEEKSVGTYELKWNAVNLPSGIYFYQLRAGSFVETKKMLLLK